MFLLSKYKKQLKGEKPYFGSQLQWALVPHSGKRADREAQFTMLGACGGGSPYLG